MRIGKKYLAILSFVAIVLGVVSCKVNYSFTGASISPEVKTFSVQNFPNTASLVSTILAPTFNTALVDKLSRSTSLSQVNVDGDMSFEGEITNYTSSPIAVTGDEYASQNRLTVTVKVRFTNKIDPKNNYNKTFSAYQDFDNTQMLQSVESTLIPQIVDQLVLDIFNAAAANW